MTSRALTIVLWLCALLAGCARDARPAPEARPAPAREAATKIDLVLTNVDINDALAELAAKARINLSVSADVSGTVTIAVHATPWDEVLDRIAKEHGLQIQRTNVMLVISKAGTQATTFSGAPIEVSFEATPIREVAQTFAAFAKVAITVDDDVQVDVTQRLRGVPWDFALDHIARKYELRLVRGADGIRITRP